MNPHDWQSYFLLVSCCIGRDNYSFLLNHATQTQFFERARRLSRITHHVTVLRLTEESFEMLEEDYRASQMLIEGE